MELTIGQKFEIRKSLFIAEAMLVDLKKKAHFYNGLVFKAEKQIENLKGLGNAKPKTA